MSQKRTYKQYPKEFKEEAVALVLEQGYSVPEAAKSLGVATNILYRWKERVEQQQEGKILVEEEREVQKIAGRLWYQSQHGGCRGMLGQRSSGKVLW